MRTDILNPERWSHEQLQAWDRQYIWHPFTQMKGWCEEEDFPVIVRGEGCELIDANGKRYLDGISSLWVNMHGHSHPEINAAMKAQIDLLQHSTLLGLANVPSILLAKQLVEIAPEGLEKVFFSDDGSTAVEVALKIAYQCRQQEGETHRTKFLAFTDAYHGDTIGSVSVGGMDLFHRIYRPLLFERLNIDYPSKFKICNEECLTPLREIFALHGSSMAAAIVEPLVQGAAGMRLAPDGYLRELRRLCDRYDVLLICDEVATGFGRTGKWFACRHEEVNPDILCLAKGLTGGVLPVAATLTTNRIYNAFYDDFASKKTLFHGHSFTGNPIGCAAALANLEILRRDRIIEHMPERIRDLQQRLETIAELRHVVEIRQKGWMVGIELVRGGPGGTPYPYEVRMGHRVTVEARRRNVLIRPLGDVIVLMPPLAISDSELERLVNVVRESIQTATESYERERKSTTTK